MTKSLRSELSLQIELHVDNGKTPADTDANDMREVISGGSADACAANVESSFAGANIFALCRSNETY